MAKLTQQEKKALFNCFKEYEKEIPKEIPYENGEGHIDTLRYTFDADGDICWSDVDKDWYQVIWNCAFNDGDYLEKEISFDTNFGSIIFGFQNHIERITERCFDEYLKICKNEGIEPTGKEFAAYVRYGDF